MTKHRLMLSAAAAAMLASPLLLAAARADTELSSIQKSSLDTTTAGNITIDADGGITIKSAAPAITFDSANTVVINSGGILSNVDTTGAGALQISTANGDIVSPGGFGFASLGSIDLSGDGNSKVGVLISGGNTFIGNVQLTSVTSTTNGVASTTGSSMVVNGDDSVSMYLVQGTTVDGTVELGGTITQTPTDKNSDNIQTRMIALEGAVNGNVQVDASSTLINIGNTAEGITVLGGIHACDSDGKVSGNGLSCTTDSSGNKIGSGALTILGSVTTAGSLTIDPKTTNLEGGSVLVIGSSIDGGVLIGGSSTANPSLTIGTLSGNGAANEPVVLIDPSRTVTEFNPVVLGPAIIGQVQAVTDPIDGVALGSAQGVGYSFINRGTINAAPVDAGIATTAMGIFGNSAANYTLFKGGLLNTGTISATATTKNNTDGTQATTSTATATAIQIGAFATVPNITVSGETYSGTSTTPALIQAEVTGAGAGTAVGVLLATGATVPTINVLKNARIIATVSTTTTTPTADFASSSNPFSLISYAILDQAGTIKTINNAGQIIASNTILNPAVGAITNNITHAIDLSAGSAGGIAINDTGSILGDILFSSSGNGNSLTVGNNAGGATGGTASSAAYAVIAGRIDTAVTNQAPVTEANVINFGSGTGHSLTVGAYGDINSVIVASSPNAVAISLGDSGILSIANAASDGTVNASTFNISGGTLLMPISQNTTAVSVPVVTAGTSAFIGPNATLGLQFTSFLSSGFTAASVANPTAQTLVLVSAPTGQLSISPTTLAQDNINLSANLPFLFQPDATPLSTTTVGAHDELVLTITPKTPTQLGLSGDAASLFPYAAASLVSDPQLGAAIATGLTVRDPGGQINNAASQAEAQKIFSQFGPDVSGGARQVAILITDQATGPVAARQRLLRSFGDQPGEMTLWSDEYFGMINNKGRVDADGSLTDYKDHGFGFSIGLDSGSPRGGWYGGAFTFYTGDITQTLPLSTKTNTQWYMLTGYTDWHGRHVFFDSQLSVGYGDLVGNRDMDVGDQTRDALGKRGSLIASIGGNTGVDLHYGHLVVEPHISLDGMTMREEGYYETGGEGLDLQVAPSYANSLRLAPGLDFKGNFSMFDFIMTPEARLGYRYDFVGSAMKVKAGFINTGGLNGTNNSFTFVGPDPDTGNVMAGFSLGAHTDTWQLGLNYDWLRGNNGSTTQVGTFTILARI